jgi:hypothetical protein
MQHATGPWCHPPELPTDPKKLCLVLLEHRKYGRNFHVMRYVRHGWKFQEGLTFGMDHKVICWAEIETDIEAPVRPVRAGTIATVALGDRIDPDALELLMKKFDQ